jgi:hypothetical protein
MFVVYKRLFPPIGKRMAPTGNKVYVELLAALGKESSAFCYALDEVIYSPINTRTIL